MKLFESGQELMVGFCEHSNELWGFVKAENFFCLSSDY